MRFFRLRRNLARFAQQCPASKSGRSISSQNEADLQKKGIDICEKKTRAGRTVFYKTSKQLEKEKKEKTQRGEERKRVGAKAKGRLSKISRGKIEELRQKLSEITQGLEKVAGKKETEDKKMENLFLDVAQSLGGLRAEIGENLHGVTINGKTGRIEWTRKDPENPAVNRIVAGEMLKQEINSILRGKNKPPVNGEVALGLTKEQKQKLEDRLKQSYVNFKKDVLSGRVPIIVEDISNDEGYRDFRLNIKPENTNLSVDSLTYEFKNKFLDKLKLSGGIWGDKWNFIPKEKQKAGQDVTEYVVREIQKREEENKEKDKKQKEEDATPLKVHVRKTSMGTVFREKLPSEIWNKIKAHAKYYDKDFLEDADAFDEEPGWRFDDKAIEILKSNGYRIF